MPSKVDDSTPSKARAKPSVAYVAYELAIPDLKPLGSLLTINTVDIFVGPKRKAFRVHEALLCDRSDYFRATFLGEFAEAKSKELYLPDDNAASFELFINWLYGGDAHISEPTSDDDLLASFGLLALAEKILIEHLRNLATDRIRAYYRSSKARVQGRDLCFVFDNTRAHLMQRSLAVVAAMQTLKTCANRGLPPDMRELVMRGGEVAAAFTKYLLYSQEHGKGTRVEHMLDANRSCTFHYHDCTPVCKGPAVGKLDDLEEGGSALKGKVGK